MPLHRCSNENVIAQAPASSFAKQSVKLQVVELPEVGIESPDDH
jgi:hypothetical protein